MQTEQPNPELAAMIELPYSSRVLNITSSFNRASRGGPVRSVNVEFTFVSREVERSRSFTVSVDEWNLHVVPIHQSIVE